MVSNDYEGKTEKFYDNSHRIICLIFDYFIVY